MDNLRHCMPKAAGQVIKFTEIVNTETMGVMLSMDERRIRQLAQAGHIPRHYNEDGSVAEGRWDVVRVIKAYIAYKLQDKKSTPASKDIEAAKLRKLNAEAEQAELKTDLMKGRVIRCVDAERTWGDFASACRSKLLSMPTKLARILLAQKDMVFIATTIEDGIREALNELKDFDVEDIQKNNPEFLLVDGDEQDNDQHTSQDDPEDSVDTDAS